MIWEESIQGFDPYKNASEYYFDLQEARRVVKFCQNNLKHSKGEFAGQLFILENWQKKIIGHLFGWKHKKTNLRRFRKIFIYLPRKNGKSFIVSALGLILFTVDNEAGADIFCLAADTAQAALVFNEASNMVLQNPALAEDIKIFYGYKSMRFEETKSTWRVLSSEAGTKHGLNPHAYIVDELHVQKDSELIEVMETGTGTRRQPLGIYLTTADYAGDSPCNKMLDYARKVRDGQIDDPTFFPVIYEAIEGEDDWKDEKTWYKTNPNLGVSIKLDYFRQQFKKALEDPSYENTFKRLHLNIQTSQERRWLKIEDWDKSGQKIEIEQLKGKECFAGLDLSSALDISAFVLYFPEFKATLPFFWVPAKTAKKRLEYELWAKQGYCTITDGDVINYEQIEQKILELKQIYTIKSIAYDPWNASQFSVRMGDKHGFQMVEFRQGYVSMNEPSKELEKMTVKHDIIHFSNPVLRWMACNCQVKEDPSGNIRPVKHNKTSPLKIDGIVALIMALGLSMQRQEQPQTSVYSEREVFIL